MHSQDNSREGKKSQCIADHTNYLLRRRYFFLTCFFFHKTLIAVSKIGGREWYIKEKFKEYCTSPLNQLFNSCDAHRWLWQVDSWPAGWWRDSSAPWQPSPCPCPLPPPTVCENRKRGDLYWASSAPNILSHTPYTHIPMSKVGLCVCSSRAQWACLLHFPQPDVVRQTSGLQPHSRFAFCCNDCKIGC